MRAVVLCAPFVAVITGACHGTLQEKMGASNVDGGPLSNITPPTCTPSMTPSDGSGNCTGGGMPGDDCLMCHREGTGVTPFTFAGTLYDSEIGSNFVGGATIYVEDAVGNVSTTLSHSGNGNFYATGALVTFPAKVFVTLCPNVVPMQSPVDMTTGADCNTASCHTTNFRVHVP